MPIPNLKFIDSTVDYFENFVQDVLHGDDENQKNHLMNRLQKFVNLHNFGKRPLDSKTTESNQVNKKLKRSHVKLPNEIWIKIMNYLSTSDKFGNFPLTCKLFHELILQPNTIKWLHMKNVTDTTKFQNVVKILKRSKTLIEVKIEDSDNCVNEIVTETLIASRNLRTIAMCNNTLNTSNPSYLPLDIVDLMKTTGNEIAALKFDHMEVSPEVMNEISKLKSLRELRLWQAITPEIIDALANNSNQLETLKCVDDTQYDFFSASDIKESIENMFYEKQKTLKKLDLDLKFKIMEPLRNLNLCQNLEKLTLSMDAPDLHIISKLPKLKSLTLFEISAQNSLPDIKSFLNTKNLTYLSFQDCDFAREIFFRELANLDFQVLERLYVHPKEREDEIMTQKTLKRFVKNAPKLKSIQFGENLTYSDISNAFLFEIFEKSQVFVIFGQLPRQISLDSYFRKRSNFVYEQYQKVRCEFSTYCENYYTY